MAFNFDTAETAIQAHLLPAMVNNAFVESHPMMSELKRRKKTYNDRAIEIGLEYGQLSNVQYMDRGDTIEISREEIATKATFKPRMLTGSIYIDKEDQLESKSDRAVWDILKTKVKNLQKGMEETAAENLWTRGVTLTATKYWNTIDYLVNEDASEDVGDLLSSGSVPAWWKSKVLDLTTDYSSAVTEDNLLNEAADIYIKKLLQRGVALCKSAKGGKKPTLIVLPQYLWDLLETILEPQKQGSPLGEQIARMGFSVLYFRGIPIVADDDMVAAQTGDTDGRIYFFVLDYLYMFNHADAYFTMEKFQRIPGSNVWESVVNLFGNLVISNRNAQCVITNVKSPKSYVTG